MISRGKATWILVGVIRAHRTASAEKFMVSAFLSAYGTPYCRVDGGATERRCGEMFR